MYWVHGRRSCNFVNFLGGEAELYNIKLFDILPFANVRQKEKTFVRVESSRNDDPSDN
jgi:hypothetical protein